MNWHAHQVRWQHDLRKITVVHRWEGAYGWIELIRAKNGEMKIQQNIHYRLGSTGASTAREYRQGHLPLLLHENPSNVLFLGLGTGLTAASAVQHVEVKRVEVVELIPEVVKAAKLLAEFNESVVDHPKVEVRIDDARHYMLGTDRRFDVIVSDLFVPWESQTGYLYTVEHYELARSRLRQGGLFCQWLALYQVGAPEFEMIADSFASVFPQTTLWWGRINSNTPMVALIGSESSLEIDVPELDARLDRLGGVLQAHDPRLQSAKRFVDLAIGQWPVRTSVRLNTDEHPRVEFLTPISHRDRRMLKRDVLQTYFDDVLVLLPSPNLRLNRVDPSLNFNVEQRRSWHRLELFGDSD